MRQGRDRVAGLVLDNTGRYLACHVSTLHKEPPSLNFDESRYEFMDE